MSLYFSALRTTSTDRSAIWDGLYYSPAVTFMAGYEHAEAENGAGTDEAEVDGFRARVQVLW